MIKKLSSLNKKTSFDKTDFQNFTPIISPFQRARSSLERSINILNISPKKRTVRNLDSLHGLIENIDFFKKCEKEQGFQCLQDILRNMHIEKYYKEDIVFEKGTIGTKFYVILKGHVSVILDKINNENGFLTSIDDIPMLKEGQSFGELALIADVPRTATIKCESDCLFAVLSKKSFNFILNKNLEINKKIEFFSNIQFFQKISKRKLISIIYFFHNKIVERNEKIYNENDESDFVYIIKKGEFKLLKKIIIENENEVIQSKIEETSKIKKKKKNFEMSVMGEFQIFGLEEVFTNEKRNFTVLCKSQNSELLYINKKEILKRINLINNPEIYNSILEYIKERKCFFENKIEIIQNLISKKNRLLIDRTHNYLQPNLEYSINVKLHKTTNSLENYYLIEKEKKIKKIKLKNHSFDIIQEKKLEQSEFIKNNEKNNKKIIIKHFNNRPIQKIDISDQIEDLLKKKEKILECLINQSNKQDFQNNLPKTNFKFKSLINYINNDTKSDTYKQNKVYNLKILANLKNINDKSSFLKDKKNQSLFVHHNESFCLNKYL